MPKPERQNILETAQLRALAFISATLLLLVCGKVFGSTTASYTPEADAIAYQAHIQACKAALTATCFDSTPNISRFCSNLGHNGQNLSVLSNSLHPAILPGQVTSAYVFLPKVKRFILFSCPRTGDPPPLFA